MFPTTPLPRVLLLLLPDSAKTNSRRQGRTRGKTILLGLSARTRQSETSTIKRQFETVCDTAIPTYSQQFDDTSTTFRISRRIELRVTNSPDLLFVSLHIRSRTTISRRYPGDTRDERAMLHNLSRVNGSVK